MRQHKILPLVIAVLLIACSAACVYAADEKAAAAADRPGNQYGHAVMVVDVARHPRSGRKVLLLAEGNTPARSIHLLRNSGHPFRSPWFVLDETADRLRFSVFRFKPEELRHF